MAQKRSEVDVNLTWNLNDIYENDEAMKKDLEKMLTLGNQMMTNYQGKLNTKENIVGCLDDLSQVMIYLSKINGYTGLAVEADITDTKAQELASNVGVQIAELMAKLTFIDSEIVEQDASTIQEAIQLKEDYKGFLTDILRNKEHRLHPEAEKVLAAISNTLSVPFEIYNTAKLADMKFDDFEVNGKTYPLGYSLYEDDYSYYEDTDVRRAAFENFSKKLKQYENVTAAAYNAQLQKEKTLSKLRGFDSIFDYLLFDQHVSMDLYNRQIDLITTQLSIHMRKYAKLIKELYHLDKVTFADLKLPIDVSFTPSVTIEESKEYIKNGLAVMGEEYTKMIDDAYQNRWVDFAKNEGKSTGGFCSFIDTVHSYILLTWNGQMSDVFTLAHELGHAGNDIYASKNGPLANGMSMYMVEAPSTINELLMANYLLKTNDEPRFRRWVLASMIGNTYYHNFVTHLLEAAYQREVYKIIDQGGYVNAPILSSIKQKVLEDFWGDEVEICEGANLTWMRQPHYYMGLYSYTYSAGLTVATQVSQRILKEGQVAVNDWKKVLGLPNCYTPVEMAKVAGVDITTDKPLLNTIAYIGSIIDEIIELTHQLEK